MWRRSVNGLNIVYTATRKLQRSKRGCELIAGDRCYLKRQLIVHELAPISTYLTGSWYGESEKNGTLNVTLVQHGDDITGTLLLYEWY